MCKKINLNKWDILHTYSTFFVEVIQDLDKVATNFMESGFAECVIASDGKTYCRSKNGYKESYTDYDSQLYGEEFSFSLGLPEEEFEEISEYSRLTWLIGARILHSEHILTGENIYKTQGYLRAFLGPCYLLDENNEAFFCYPHLTIYSTGILVLQFRVLSPDETVALEEFIKDYLNMPFNEFKGAFVPTFISAIAPILNPASEHRVNLSTFFNYQIHCKEVESLTQEENQEFNFKLAPLGLPEQDNQEKLHTLALTILGAAGFLIHYKDFNITNALEGLNKFPNMKFWTGRPHSIIYSYSEQQPNATEDEIRNASTYRKVLNRSLQENRIDSSLNNLRTQNDYNLYINSSTSLCVWSKELYEKSINNETSYDYYATTLILEYYYMLYTKLVSETYNIQNTNDLFNTWTDINDIKADMMRVGHYGEFWNLLVTGWKEMGIDLLKEQIKNNLTFLESKTKITESNKTDFITIIITILVVILSTPPFADSVTKPIWAIFGFWKPINENHLQLFYVGITAIFIFLIIAILFLVIKKKK